MRLLFGLVGGVTLVATTGSVLRNLVVPRGLRSRLVTGLWRSIRALLLLVARPLPGYLRRDRLLAWLAPLVLVGTLVWWLGGFFVSYALLMYAVSGLTWVDSFREAGSSLFTLGYASGVRPRLTVLDFAAAATGPIVVALQIAYLPTLYAAYNRRETEVTLLQARAGEPAWGPELLARQAMIATTGQLAQFYQDWERLAADIGESHANYPILLAFRSPQPYRSWIVGLMAVLDAAATQLALTPGAPASADARLMLRAGFTALRDIARVVRIPYDPDPYPDGPISLTFAEFQAGVDRIRQAGLQLERTAEQAWPHFQGWRVNYEAIGYALARQNDAVPALWSGPRDWAAEPMPPQRPLDRRPVPHGEVT